MANTTTSKPVYRTTQSGQIRYNSPTGDGTEKTYGYEIDNKGNKRLVITGEKNTYLEIQSHADEVAIETVLANVAVGNYTNFRPDGIYADITEIPKNMIEARKEINKLENLWEHMTPEIKNKYNWSLDEFISSAGSDAWLTDTGLAPKKEIEFKPDIKVETKVDTPKETS